MAAASVSSDAKYQNNFSTDFSLARFRACLALLKMDIPLQEQNQKWFKSHLLDRSIELQELYELPQGELDLLLAETAELRSDSVNRDRNHGKWCTAGYFLELARLIDQRRGRETSSQ